MSLMVSHQVSNEYYKLNKSSQYQSMNSFKITIKTNVNGKIITLTLLKKALIQILILSYIFKSASAIVYLVIHSRYQRYQHFFNVIIYFLSISICLSPFFPYNAICFVFVIRNVILGNQVVGKGYVYFTVYKVIILFYFCNNDRQVKKRRLRTKQK